MLLLYPGELYRLLGASSFNSLQISPLIRKLMKFDSSDKIVLNITNTCNNNNIFFLTDPKNLQKISNLQHCLKFYDLDT